jgi:hypothetical protein
MLPNWQDRPEVTANLLNPAFCGKVIAECIGAYKKEANTNFPFALSIFILPLIVNGKIRERLPKTKSKTLHSWLIENEDLKIGLKEQITALLPFTRETIMFAIAHNSLSIDENGNLETKGKQKKFEPDNEELKLCLAKAVTLGKVLSKSGTVFTIYSMFGVKP